MNDTPDKKQHPRFCSASVREPSYMHHHDCSWRTPDKNDAAVDKIIEDFEDTFAVMLERYTAGATDTLRDDMLENVRAHLRTTLQDFKEDVEREMVAKAESLMLQDIYYIGDDLPQVTQDKRQKFVLLGTPQSFLSRLRTLLSNPHTQ